MVKKHHITKHLQAMQGCRELLGTCNEQTLQSGNCLARRRALGTPVVGRWWYAPERPGTVYGRFRWNWEFWWNFGIGMILKFFCVLSWCRESIGIPKGKPPSIDDTDSIGFWTLPHLKSGVIFIAQKGSNGKLCNVGSYDIWVEIMSSVSEWVNILNPPNKNQFWIHSLISGMLPSSMISQNTCPFFPRLHCCTSPLLVPQFWSEQNWEIKGLYKMMINHSCVVPSCSGMYNVQFSRVLLWNKGTSWILPKPYGNLTTEED